MGVYLVLMRDAADGDAEAVQERGGQPHRQQARGCAAAEGEPNDWAQTGLGVRNMVAALAVLDAGFCPSNILAGSVRIAREMLGAADGNADGKLR